MPTQKTSPSTPRAKRKKKPSLDTPPSTPQALRRSGRDHSGHPFGAENLKNINLKKRGANGFEGRLFSMRFWQELQILGANITPHKARLLRKEIQRLLAKSKLACRKNLGLSMELVAMEKRLARIKPIFEQAGSKSVFHFFAAPVLRIITFRRGEGEKKHVLSVTGSVSFGDLEALAALVKVTKRTPQKSEREGARKRKASPGNSRRVKSQKPLSNKDSSGDLEVALRQGAVGVKSPRRGDAGCKFNHEVPREHAHKQHLFSQKTIDYLQETAIREQINSVVKSDPKPSKNPFVKKLFARKDIKRFIKEVCFPGKKVVLTPMRSKTILLLLNQSYEILHKVAHSLCHRNDKDNLFFGTKLLNSIMCLPEAIGRMLNKKCRLIAETKFSHAANQIQSEKKTSPYSHVAEGMLTMIYKVFAHKLAIEPMLIVSFEMPVKPLQAGYLPLSFCKSAYGALIEQYVEEGLAAAPADEDDENDPHLANLG